MRENYLGNRDIAIIGFAETKYDRKSEKTPYELAAEVLHQLLERTGVRIADVDGMASTVPTAEAGNTFWTNMLADTLGLELAWSQLTDIGGGSPTGNVARAAAAITTGMCEMVFCIGADSSAMRASRSTGYRAEFVDPVGLMGPPAAFGLLSAAYDQKYGLDLRALGKLAVAQRNGAVVNENACDSLRKPMTVDDYLGSRMVAEPIRLLDCVMRVDGANGLLVTSTERARKLGQKRLVHPIAYAEVTNFEPRDSLPDPTRSGFSRVGPAALAKAGLTPADIRMFHPYDDFLIAIMLQLEQIGFCKPGEGAAYIHRTDFSPAGALPLNTGGGQISCGQPGLAGGGVNLIEAVRQLMGEAGRRQVPKPSNALVTGIGVIPYLRNWGTSTALVLEAA
ncbi:MAG: thiolase family protein [Alphaproteobacteria bacterium]|nr:thiolase family protein [Alphaproteobacteria bacterium]